MKIALIIILAAILIGTRLPSFFVRQNVSTKGQVLLTIIIYLILGAAFLAVDGFEKILSLFQAL